MNDEAVYKTALATPGLLNILEKEHTNKLTYNHRIFIIILGLS